VTDGVVREAASVEFIVDASADVDAVAILYACVFMVDESTEQVEECWKITFASDALIRSRHVVFPPLHRHFTNMA
jgi:hypothetical protein